jgi:hypothetical protein
VKREKVCVLFSFFFLEREVKQVCVFALEGGGGKRLTSPSPRYWSLSQPLWVVFFCSSNLYGIEAFGPLGFDPVKVCICVYFLFFFFPLSGRRHEMVTESVFPVVSPAISGRSLIRHFHLVKPNLFPSANSLLTHSPWWCSPSSMVVICC